jgi:EAL domain-containing protein (putative c-di-GMP-specific phosphodiesterase class I)
MSERSIFSNLVRQPDGAFSALYGPCLLQSALQPIFAEQADGQLRIAALKGLVRASVNGDPTSPAEFFQGVPEEDRAAVDGLCRSLHILNAGALGRRDAWLVINFHAGLYGDAQAVRQEVEWLRLAAHEAGLPLTRIACEIREHPHDDPDDLMRLAARLHESGFSIAIDNYNGEGRDLERLQRLTPQFVTFDAAWLESLADNSAGLALVRLLVGQLAEKDIRAIVSGIEEPAMIDRCREMGGPLMQGYLLARPELAPTSFNATYPEPDAEPAAAEPAPRAEGLPTSGENRALRPVRQFGRRGI